LTLVINLHHFELASRSNGPGKRAVIWVQGCSLGCANCFNPKTHPHTGGFRINVDELARKVIHESGNLEGLTISGGEPLQQIKPLINFLRQIKTETNFSVIVFTGFTLSEIMLFPEAVPLLQNIDVLIAGRYEKSGRIAKHLIGSSNKIFHFYSDRYTPEDFLQVPDAEILIDIDGKIGLSGIDPLVW
jgi:anaerobic ribonucleoside-triphosphate reductase activating protein